jgi:hypothetical protein
MRLLADKMEFENGRPKPTYKHKLLAMIDEFPALGKLVNILCLYFTTKSRFYRKSKIILKLMAEQKTTATFWFGHYLAPIAFRLSAEIQHRSVPWRRLLSSESALSAFATGRPTCSAREG